MSATTIFQPRYVTIKRDKHLMHTLTTPTARESNIMTSKVLIVDDEKVIQELLIALLETEGYEICTASNGEEGLRQFQEAQPDLIVSDVMMPVMDGYEFCRRVREISDVPIIMITGMGGHSENVLKLNLVDVFMDKPIEMDDFLSQVDTLLNRNRDIGLAKAV